MRAVASSSLPRHRILRVPILPRETPSLSIAEAYFIEVFDASASSENAQKNSLLSNGLSGTRGGDPKFARSRACEKAAAAEFSRNKQYAAHSATTQKFFTTRQHVAFGTPQQKRNTCAPITSVRAHA